MFRDNGVSLFGLVLFIFVLTVIIPLSLGFLLFQVLSIDSPILYIILTIVIDLIVIRHIAKTEE